MVRTLLLSLLLFSPALAVPNVIVIVADDLSWRDLGCMGATDLQTPAIDSLATNGVKFLQAYATAPVCSPSRAGLLTGRYQQRFGQETNPGPDLEDSPSFGLPATEATMGNRFRELKYATGWIGKSHLGSHPPYHPNNRGFDEFFGFLRSHHNYVNPSLPVDQVDPILHNNDVVPNLPYLTVALGGQCVQFIEDHKNEPFFLFAPFSAVHFDDNFELPAPQYLHDRIAQVEHPSGIRKDMAAVLLGLDDAVAAILAKLEQRGLLQSTLIFFTSDNGGDPTFGASNGILRGGKTEVYEGGIRVPFIVQWKDHIPVAVKTVPVSTLDILPTAIAATGHVVPAAWQLDGVNLLPWLMGQSAAPSRQLFWRMETDGVPPTAAADVKDGLRAMRQGQWKLVKTSVDSSWELYDLSTDPGETNNVADANASLVLQMIADYDEWGAQTARPRWAWNHLDFADPDFVLQDVAAGPADPYVEPPTTFSFQCPELNNETCYASVTNHSAITLMRSSMTPFATLSVPSRNLYSVKPRVFNGVTYFSCAAYENDDPLNPGVTEMWLLGLGPDANHRLARQVDEPDGTNHRSPDTLITGQGELLFTYARGTQARRASTGLRLNDHMQAPSGFTTLPFSGDFHASERADSNGTETTHLVAHQGMLFAGQGSLNAPQDGSFTGAQILVKEDANDAWSIESALPIHRRVEVLEELSFTHEGTTPLQGNATHKLLTASFSDVVPILNAVVGIRTRIAPHVWQHSEIPSPAGGVPISLAAHYDQSGSSVAQNIFAGISSGEIHRGVYDSGIQQRFMWNASQPEHTGVGPVMGFANANGVLYAACGLRQDTVGGTVSGGLYRRNDLTQNWSLVYRWLAQESVFAAPAEFRVMRGLTAVPDPRGNSGHVLLAARSWPGVVERIDPGRDHAVTVELDVRDFFARLWGDESVRTAPVILGYNAFTPVPNPVTGEVVHLISLWIEHPGHGGAHFLVRHLDATYEAATIDSPYELRASRCSAVSPFGEDAIYVGGFDNSLAPTTESAWIARGEWSAWPQIVISQPDPPFLQLNWPVTSGQWLLETSGELSTWQTVGGFPARSLTTTTQSIDMGTTARGFYRLKRPAQ